MRINRDVEYALMSIQALSEGEEAQSARELADKFSLPYELLSKILQRLVRSRLLESVRGAGGGYRPARDIHHITIGEVFEAVAGPASLVACGAHKECRHENGCTIRPGIKRLEESWQNLLSSMTLGDLQG